MKKRVNRCRIKNCRTVIPTRWKYCEYHKEESHREASRLAMARMRSRRMLDDLNDRIRNGMENEEPVARLLGTGNLYEHPVLDDDGKIDFEEESRRIKNEMKRLRLKSS